MSVVLIPIIKDKKAKIGSIDNYRPVTIASVVSKVVERIVHGLSDYLDTMGNQFGSYSQLNVCVFSCFCYASKAFDRVKHSMLFTKLLRRGAPGLLYDCSCFGMRIRQCVLDVVVQSHRNLQCLMGSGKGEFCHRFCLMYSIYRRYVC